MPKKALITGVTGQDGSYLSEFLLEKGYEVHGLIRRSSSFNTHRIDHLYKDIHEPSSRFFLHYGDLVDGVHLTNLLRKIEPDEIYNLAAQSHVGVSFSLPQYTAQVDGLGVLTLLEAIRVSELPIKFYQASTSELFGLTPPPQSERSSFHPRSPYAISKLMAYWATINYREAYGLFAVNGILFNHESPRRGETFVTRKISMAAARISKGSAEKLFLGNLDAVRDWGYAKEYVEYMWKMLQAPEPMDLLLSTGIGATVRDFCKIAFESVNLDYKKYVEIDPRYIRPSEVDALIGDSSLAKSIIGWDPKVDWQTLAKIMVEADLKLLDESGPKHKKTYNY